MNHIKFLDEFLSLFIEGIEALMFIIRLKAQLLWEDYGSWFHTWNCMRCGQPAIKALDWKWCSKRCKDGKHEEM